MSIQLISCTSHYLKTENFDISENFPEELSDFLSTKDINYTEEYQDIALRCSIADHLIPVMQNFFKEKFICHYLSTIFTNNDLLKQNRAKQPVYIFIDSKQDEFLEFKTNNSLIKIADKKRLHKEISALSDALGLNLNERDNYPGGKQKVAFQLIDISWSAINSKLPLIIY